METSRPTEVSLEALVSEFTGRCRDGDAPSVDDYAARHPALAAEIRSLFPTIESLENLKRRRTSVGRSLSGTPQKLGDYRIVREIGRGGMGVVYEAVQQSLNRRVAVKLMAPQARRDEGQLQRFLSEARIAGRLHHSNIVPVLGVGVHDGLQYYVMQYIDGKGLNHYISQLKEPATRGADESPDATLAAPQLAATTQRVDAGSPTTVEDATINVPERWREVARIGLQVAQALDYAHRHEILHRDIKPANLLLDSQGSAWVTDFGVAKSTFSGDLTRTGAILGTPDYMAPEQAAGDADARSDVYSLGVTLYEMLALRLPHTEPRLGRGRRSIHFSPASPISRFAKDVPRDLETIVMKAIEEHPPQRYQTAGELAEDLTRFLDQRPVLARRATLLDHWRSWQRRNPVAAWLAAALFALANLAAVAGMIGFAVTRSALQRESVQRKRAEDAIAVSWEALDRAFARLAPDQLAGVRSIEGVDEATLTEGQPVVSPETAALLEELLPYYGRLAAFTATDGRTRTQSASAARRVGDIELRLGDFEKAEAAYRSAIEIVSKQSGESDAEPRRIEMARLFNQLGSLAQRGGRNKEGEAEFRRAFELLKGKVATPQGRFELARTCYLLGRPPAPMEYSTAIPSKMEMRPKGPGGPPEGGEPGAFPPPPRGGFPPGRRDAKGPPREPRDPFEGGEPGEGFGRPPPRKGKRPPRRQPVSEEGRRLLADAIEILGRNASAESSDHSTLHLLALCHRELADREDFSSKEYLEAVRLFESLVVMHPDDDEHRFELARTYGGVDPRGIAPEHASAALDRLRNAVKHTTLLVERHPYAADYAIQHVHTLNKLSSLLQHQGRGADHGGESLADAEKYMSEAVRRQGELARRFPKVPAHRFWHLTFAGNCAEIQYVRERWREAADTILRAAESVPQGLMEIGDIRNAMASNYDLLADARKKLGDETGAGDAQVMAEKLRVRDSNSPARFP